MIHDIGLRLLLTAAFAGSGALCAYRSALPFPVATRIGDGLHVLMSAGMIAMLWPWGMDVPPLPQAVAFGAAAAWFAVFTVLGRGHEQHGGRPGQAHHALMMAAMVWMVAAMPLVMHGTPVAGASGGAHAGHGGMSGTTSMAGPPAHVVVVGAVAAAAFLGWAVWWLARAIDIGRAYGAPAFDRAVRLRALTSAAHAAMSLGMAAMSLAMAT